MSLTHKLFITIGLIVGSFFSARSQDVATHQSKPNVIIINADDLGYGDVSCYGATKIQTPNIDALAKQGIRFTNAHSSAATCTPSRYSLITGRYAWRKKGTGILPGDAALIIPTNEITLPKVFKQAGYATAVVGKWHLGLGDSVEKNWNGEIKPGPNEVGFDYSFIFPATADRVPTVFLKNHSVIALEKNDTIKVDYKNKIGNEPTGKEHPQLLKMQASQGQGHDGTIVNGIGRIGYMRGGKKARWADEELAPTFLSQAKNFIEQNKNQPFFLYYALNEPHVPRMPATMFKNKSILGYRGDAILELDWAVGELMQQIQYLGLTKNTIIIFTSDNGPVLDDGYQDDAVAKSKGHKPAGEFRGGKYSIFEGGTRLPFIVSWQGKLATGVSDALVCQVDLLQSFASFFNENISNDYNGDGENMMNVFLGKDKKGRTSLIEQSSDLAIIKDGWKYIEPNNGAAYYKLTGTESGNSLQPQLYDLMHDAGEKNNLATKYPDKVKALEILLKQVKDKSN